jgi:hypothetical protein
MVDGIVGGFELNWLSRQHGVIDHFVFPVALARTGTLLENLGAMFFVDSRFRVHGFLSGDAIFCRGLQHWGSRDTQFRIFLRGLLGSPPPDCDWPAFCHGGSCGRVLPKRWILSNGGRIGGGNGVADGADLARSLAVRGSVRFVLRADSGWFANKQPGYQVARIAVVAVFAFLIRPGRSPFSSRRNIKASWGQTG